ncbi:MAG: ABC transporter permease [Terracidiphilus sp.]|jgi:predicted permease
MSWLSIVFDRRRIYDELSEEMRSHLEERTEQFMREGTSRKEAEEAARRAFGNTTLLEEQSREVWQWSTLESVWVDARHAARLLCKSPGFTIAAVLTLALAIGANAVVFGVLNALILRPVNVPDAKSLYAINHASDDNWESYPNYLDLRDRNHSFDSMAAMALSQVALDTGKDPSRIWGFEATGNYFDVLGIQPFLGRFFHPSDEKGMNSAPYIVLSYAYWHSRFQDDRSVPGRAVRVNGHPFTVIGVTPPDFQGTFVFFAPNFYVPMVNHDQLVGERSLSRRGGRSLIQVLGHLRQGVTTEGATADLNTVGAGLAKAYPNDDAREVFSLGRPSMPGVLGRPVRAFVSALMVLAGLILLAACANLGSLFAARASDRSREVALRLALGSSRKRILRQLLTEAVLVSLAGGVAGLTASIALLRALDRWQPFSGVPIHVPVRPDANVYIVALVLALVSGLLFGIVPVRQVLGANPYEIVKAGSTGRVGRHVTVRDILLVVQIAICAVLVTSSMVAVRGLARSMRTNFGVDPNNVLMVETDLKMAGYGPAEIPPMQRRMIDALESLPGVEHVGLVNFAPLGRGGSWSTTVFRDGTTDLRPSNAAATSYMYVISPGYLHAAGTTLLEGRNFDWNDKKGAPQVAIVNRDFAARMLGSSTNAVGKYFETKDGTRVQVVGIVENGKYLSVTEAQQPAMYVPVTQQDPLGEQWLLVRSSRDSQHLAAAVRGRLRELNAGMPLDILMWKRELDFSMFPARMASLALGVLGIMGAILSITGIFGMAAYSVSKRLRELGIRVALGAQRSEVLRTALGRAVKLLAIGSTAGLLLGLLATRVLSFIVYQATPRDPVVLGGVAVAMALLGLVATWIPAQRALSVDPLILLREE